MNTFIKILGSLSIIIGTFVVFSGIIIGVDARSAIGVIAGGGLFMALGITIFVLCKD